jgi:hypothetical protein
MELTEQESQLLEMIRELDEGEQLRLAVARRNGQWEVIVSAPPRCGTTRAGSALLLMQRGTISSLWKWRALAVAEKPRDSIPQGAWNEPESILSRPSPHF